MAAGSSYLHRVCREQGGRAVGGGGGGGKMSLRSKGSWKEERTQTQRHITLTARELPPAAARKSPVFLNVVGNQLGLSCPLNSSALRKCCHFLVTLISLPSIIFSKSYYKIL